MKAVICTNQFYTEHARRGEVAYVGDVLTLSEEAAQRLIGLRLVRPVDGPEAPEEDEAGPTLEKAADGQAVIYHKGGGYYVVMAAEDGRVLTASVQGKEAARRAASNHFS